MTTSGDSHVICQIGSIPADVTRNIRDLIGQDLSEHKFFVYSYAIRHILKAHGEEKRKGQSSITRDDPLCIPQILTHADAIADAGHTNIGRSAVLFCKKITDHLTLVMEVRAKKKRLAVTSMRKYPGAQKYQKESQADAHTSKTFREANDTTPHAAGSEFIIDTVAYARKRKTAPGQQELRWITIGGTAEDEKEHVGGTPVQIKAVLVRSSKVRKN